MTNSLLYHSIHIHFLLRLIEASGEVFNFHPASSGYFLHGIFEVPKENFVGNQFWICFDYQTRQPTDKPRQGRYSRSVDAQNEEESFEDTNAITYWSSDSPSVLSIEDYPSIECGGSPMLSDPSTPSYWFALNGRWLGEQLLQLEFLNVGQLSDELARKNVTWSNVNEKYQWKLAVSFQRNHMPSALILNGLLEYKVPEMDPQSSVQIRVNGFGARIGALVPNIRTLVYPMLPSAKPLSDLFQKL